MVDCSTATLPPTTLPTIIIRPDNAGYGSDFRPVGAVILLPTPPAAALHPMPIYTTTSVYLSHSHSLVRKILLRLACAPSTH